MIFTNNLMVHCIKFYLWCLSSTSVTPLFCEFTSKYNYDKNKRLAEPVGLVPAIMVSNWFYGKKVGRTIWSFFPGFCSQVLEETYSQTAVRSCGGVAVKHSFSPRRLQWGELYFNLTIFSSSEGNKCPLQDNRCAVFIIAGILIHWVRERTNVAWESIKNPLKWKWLPLNWDFLI